MPTGKHALALLALLSWLLTEALGAFMLRTWFSSGAARRRHDQPDSLPLPVVLGHAGLAFSGFVCWIAFVASRSPAPAWLAAALLAPAIGLGISTVTVWTPYPVQRPPDEADVQDWLVAASQRGVLSDELIEQALSDEALSSRLVDSLLDRNLADNPPAPRTTRSHLRPIIPFAHGVLAITTFFLVTVAAVAGS